MAEIEENNAELMAASVAHFLEHSKIKSNGVREIPKAAFVSALEKHGVRKDEIDRVQAAVDFETTAASRVALHDLEASIKGLTKDQLADENHRRALSATVRIPTFGGSTDVTLSAETRNPIPFRGDGEGEPQFKTTYGRLRTSINGKGRVHKDFHDEAATKIRSLLGVPDDTD